MLLGSPASIEAQSRKTPALDWKEYSHTRRSPTLARCTSSKPEKRHQPRSTVSPPAQSSSGLGHSNEVGTEGRIGKGDGRLNTRLDGRNLTASVISDEFPFGAEASLEDAIRIGHRLDGEVMDEPRRPVATFAPPLHICPLAWS